MLRLLFELRANVTKQFDKEIKEREKEESTTVQDKNTH
jgi:hypothetical protein